MIENFKIYDGRSSFWQWDSEQKIIVPENCDEAHFSLEGDSKALPCKVYEIHGTRIADVPNILLQKNGNLIAYAYLQNENGGKTLFCQAFTIQPKPKPDDYVYTETEVMTWQQLDERISALEKSGGVDPEYIGNLVENYLDKNPPAPGADGKDGITPEFSIGEVETLPAGSEATATITGTKENPVLNLGIPKGEKGAAGEGGGTGEIPSALPNPYKLTLTGAVSAKYDGSTPVEVNIPAGGGGGAEWKLVADVTLEENVGMLSIDTDINGNQIADLSYGEIFVILSLIGLGNGNYASRYSDLSMWFSKNDSGGYNSTFSNLGNGYDATGGTVHAICPKPLVNTGNVILGHAQHSGGVFARFQTKEGIASVKVKTVAGLVAGSRIIVYGR